MPNYAYIALIPLLPLASFVVLGLFGRKYFRSFSGILGTAVLLLCTVLSVWVAVASSAAPAFFFFLAHAGEAARLSAKPSTAVHANNLIVKGFISEFLFILDILDAVSRGLPQAQRGGQSSTRRGFAPEPHQQIGLIVSEAVNHAKS